jgi:hypothetical protein
MKTHAVKENRILKSFDFALIVLTMSFVSFIIFRSLVFIPDFSIHSKTNASQKVDFTGSEQKGVVYSEENTAQEPTLFKLNPTENAVPEVKSEKAETSPVLQESNSGTIIQEGNHLEAAKADQSSTVTRKSKVKETAPVNETHFEQANLAQWIKNRDDWEQK